MNQTKKKCPCKINVMLAITNPRPDGFHDLVSLVSPVNFCDDLTVELASSTDSLSCNISAIPTDSSNLVMKAAELFRKKSGIDAHFKFELFKRVPAGAGLGGGSGDGATALLAVNELCGNILDMPALMELAAQMGSDCPLFLSKRSVVMRGRGEQIEDLDQHAQDVIESMKLMIFKPSFSINTGAAYKRMRENGTYYIPKAEAENILSSWLKNPSLKDLPLVNNMQLAAFEEYPQLKSALDGLKRNFSIPAMMSGSGSACFAVVNDIAEDKAALKALCDYVKSALGQDCMTEFCL